MTLQTLEIPDAHGLSRRSLCLQQLARFDVMGNLLKFVQPRRCNGFRQRRWFRGTQLLDRSAPVKTDPSVGDVRRLADEFD